MGGLRLSLLLSRLFVILRLLVRLLLVWLLSTVLLLVLLLAILFVSRWVLFTITLLIVPFLLICLGLFLLGLLPLILVFLELLLGIHVLLASRIIVRAETVLIYLLTIAIHRLTARNVWREFKHFRIDALLLWSLRLNFDNLARVRVNDRIYDTVGRDMASCRGRIVTFFDIIHALLDQRQIVSQVNKLFTNVFQALLVLIRWRELNHLWLGRRR